MDHPTAPSTTTTQTLDHLLEAVTFYQGIVLDNVEQELGDTPSWHPLRARLLKAFGDRGLAKRIRLILENASR